MKLSIDCRMVGSGGIGSYISALLPFFTENYECYLFGNLKKLNKYSDKARIIECNINTFSLNEMFFFPRKLLQVINSSDAFYTPYCNIPGGIKVPVFSTIHDVVFLDVRLSGKTGTFIRKCFYQHALNKSKAVFTVSEFSKKRIEHHLKTKRTPVIVTYNAVPNWFADQVKYIQKENYILFVGNIKKHKGLHTLLEAYKHCIANGFNTKLKIVGNANNFRTCDTSIGDEIKNLNESVEFTGRISDSELKNIYAKAKLLIQPSLYEGFGMPPMEALTLGTNCIISDIPVFKEIYENLPVIFFQTENSADLAQKIQEHIEDNSPILKKNPYSFENTFKIIQKNILL